VLTGSGAKGGARVLGVLHGSYPVERRDYHEVTGDVICPSHVRGIDHIRDPRLNKVSAAAGAFRGACALARCGSRTRTSPRLICSAFSTQKRSDLLFGNQREIFTAHKPIKKH